MDKFIAPEMGDYVFEIEPSGNNQMICEIRGVGAGLYDRNRQLLLDRLNAAPGAMTPWCFDMGEVPKNAKSVLWMFKTGPAVFDAINGKPDAEDWGAPTAWALINLPKAKP